jgi:hypothetical protein
MNGAQVIKSQRRDGPSFDRRGLVVFHVRRTPWGPVLLAAAIGGAAVTLRALYSDSAREMLPFARLSAVLIAAAAAVALENPCAAITSTTSLRRSASAWLTIALTGVGAMVAWLPPVLVARRITGEPGGLPIGGVVIEFAALLVIGWLFTEMISKSRGPSGAGTSAGVSLTMAAIISVMTPYTMKLLWRGPDPDWADIHARWALIAAIATACLAVGLRDSAAPWPSLRKIHQGDSVEESDEC